MPRGVISSVLVSETGGLGANPSEAANLIYELRLMIDDLKTEAHFNKGQTP